MNDTPGPLREGWGTLPYSVALALLVVLALGLVIVTVIAVRRHHWGVRGIVATVAAALLGVVAVALALVIPASTDVVDSHGATHEMSCGTLTVGALSSAMSRGIPDDHVLSEPQRLCRSACRRQSFAAFGMVALPLVGVTALALRGRRTPTAESAPT